MLLASKDIWHTLTPKKKVEKVAEALEQLQLIAKPKSELKTGPDQGRLANVKKSLEEFLINAIAWESEKQLQRHY